MATESSGIGLIHCDFPGEYMKSAAFDSDCRNRSTFGRSRPVQRGARDVPPLDAMFPTLRMRQRGLGHDDWRARDDRNVEARRDSVPSVLRRVEVCEAVIGTCCSSPMRNLACSRSPPPRAAGRARAMAPAASAPLATMRIARRRTATRRRARPRWPRSSSHGGMRAASGELTARKP
jgi:hypothetical protein